MGREVGTVVGDAEGGEAEGWYYVTLVPPVDDRCVRESSWFGWGVRVHGLPRTSARWSICAAPVLLTSSWCVSNLSVRLCVGWWRSGEGGAATGDSAAPSLTHPPPSAPVWLPGPGRASAGTRLAAFVFATG